MASNNEHSQSMNPTSIDPQSLARMLGLKYQIIEKHVAQGAPLNPDGTMNLIHYAAWLNTNKRDD